MSLYKRGPHWDSRAKYAVVYSIDHRNICYLDVCKEGYEMPRTGRPGLTHREKRELWHRWKVGQTLSKIGHALNRHAGSVHGVLAVTGGIEHGLANGPAVLYSCMNARRYHAALAEGSAFDALPN